MSNAGARLVVLAAPLILLGCSNGEERVSTASVRRQPAQNLAPEAAPSSAAYVASASSIELYEIESAQLALKRARTKRVRDFAAMVLQAHNLASMQLSLAGRRLNLLPSATLSAKHQAMMAELREGPDFDAVYRRQQVAVQREALAVHRNYAALGTSPTLRPVAASLAAVFQTSLGALNNL